MLAYTQEHFAASLRSFLALPLSGADEVPCNYSCTSWLGRKLYEQILSAEK